MAQLARFGRGTDPLDYSIGPPPPVDVRILIVTDEYGSFDERGFGMASLLDVLATPPGPWGRFRVTTANRRADSTANLPNFRFDAPTTDLGTYDEIWLMGIERLDHFVNQVQQPTRLPPSELAALADFQDAGGGVFATGDHEDLGANLCGEVLRVRSMRRWFVRGESPNGYPDAPPRDFTTRPPHTTLVGPYFSEEDTTAQTIHPTYWQIPGAERDMIVQFPHPLLCSPVGVIKHLPDHMHEGSCDLLGSFDDSYRWADRTYIEYPGGYRPVIVAEAENHFAREGFPAIAAYDGHTVNVGRVVTDSTWHHFFNVNLHGFRGTAPGTPEHRVWQEIQSYFRNIAVWLARPTTQRRMAARALWRARWRGDVVITVDQRAGLDFEYFYSVGDVAMDSLGRLATQCEAYLFTGLIDPGSDILPTPWDDQYRKEAMIKEYVYLVRTAAVGGAIHSLAKEYPAQSDVSPKDEEMLDVLRSGLNEGVQAVVKYLEETADLLPAFIQKLKAFEGSSGTTAEVT